MRDPTCRLCSAPLRHTLVDLGSMPLANSFVTCEQVARGEDRAYPLHARVCDRCWLVQVDDAVPAASIFSNYAYFSSFSSSWVAHAARYADMMINRFGLGRQALVVEVASNDGYLLKHFQRADLAVLGIEPAENVAAAANRDGIPTEVHFFGAASARAIACRHGQADLIAANNVLAHVPDILDFAAGFPVLLKPYGVATFEFPHLLNLLEQVQFDTIYHEHYAYLSLLVVERLVLSVGMRVFDVEELPTHGGSLRVFACHLRAPHARSPAVQALRLREIDAGLDRLSTYEAFAPKVSAAIGSLRRFVAERRGQGRRIAAYGAAAKGNTLLNSAGINRSDILCVADRNPAKQGKLTPGSHIPVVSPDAMAEGAPDDVLILPWNLAPEIADQLAGVFQQDVALWVARPEIKRL
jgi:SAM-dependent methyltransferase